MPLALTPSLHSRKLGSVLGLIVGDALGATNEFQQAGEFAPITDMVGGGPFSLPAGAWTDDSSMALCLAESLVELRRFEPQDQMERYLRWRRTGYLSSIGRCFDVGITTHQALVRFERSGNPMAGSSDPQSAGNGSIMRLAPVVAWAAADPANAIRLARESSRTTHRAAESVDGCELLARLLLRAYGGGGVVGPLAEVPREWSAGLREVAAMDGARGKQPARQPTGYVVDTLSCARWCVARGGSFQEAVLLAANLGGDADTIAAVTGQLAGAAHGVEGIPTRWIDKLAERKRVMELATAVVTGPA